MEQRPALRTRRQRPNSLTIPIEPPRFNMGRYRHPFALKKRTSQSSHLAASANAIEISKRKHGSCQSFPELAPLDPERACQDHLTGDRSVEQIAHCPEQ